jgi:hypothetical protein
LKITTYDSKRALATTRELVLQLANQKGSPRGGEGRVQFIIANVHKGEPAMTAGDISDMVFTSGSCNGAIGTGFCGRGGQGLSLLGAGPESGRGS